MKKEEIIEKLNKIRLTRIIDIYKEEEFSGKGLIVNKEGKVYIYEWYLALSIEKNEAKEIYKLEEFKIDINKLKIDYPFSNKENNCINIIDYNNIKIENNDLNYYNKIMKEVIKCRQ